MVQYKPNSHRSKEAQNAGAAPAQPERPKPEKVISGKAVAKPKGKLAQIAGNFIVEDFKKVKEYIIKDVILPTLKDMLWTSIARGSERMLYGESGHSPKNSKLGHINYGGIFKQVVSNGDPARSTNRQHFLDSIILDDYGDAQRVLAAMEAYIAKYGSVTVAELHEFIDEPMGDYTNTQWGWRSVNTVTITRVSDGKYKINLPEAVSLKD